MLHRQKEHLRGPLEVRLEEKAKRLHPLFPLFHCDPHWRGWHPDHFLQIILICSHSNRFCWSACIDAAAIVALTVNCVQPEAVALQRSWQNNLCPLRLRMRKKKGKIKWNISNNELNMSWTAAAAERDRDARWFTLCVKNYRGVQDTLFEKFRRPVKYCSFLVHFPFQLRINPPPYLRSWHK